MQSEGAVLVFDIGGVLVKLGGMVNFMKWTGQRPEQIQARWLRCEAVREFESGKLPFESFASGVIREFGLPIGADELREEMTSWMGELFDGAHELLAETSARHRTVCLCNANEIQWRRVRDELELDQWFAHQFVSHEIGLVKPDLEIYDHVTSQLGVSPRQVSFFDDSLPNVEGAKMAGWNAYHVRGVEELRSQLTLLRYL